MLPAMEMDDATRFIMKMKDEPNIQHYLSACTSLSQKNFIEAQSKRYKEMVRLIKYWKSKQQWTVPGSAPISYLLELLMLNVYNQYAHLETDTSVYGGLFQRCLDLITRLSAKTCITFNMYYHETVANIYHQNKSNETQGDIPGKSLLILLITFVVVKEIWKIEFFISVILDPTNPCMNVASRLTNFQPLRDYANVTLIELQMTMAKSIDNWTNTQQRLLSWNKRLVTFQNYLLKTKTGQTFSIKDIKLSTLKDIKSQSEQIGPFLLYIGADIEIIDKSKKYWRLYLSVEHVHQDWPEFKNSIIGTSKNVRIDFKLHISRGTICSYEPISKQWTATPATGQKVYLTTKEEKLKFKYSQHTFDVDEYYWQENVDIRCEINLVLFP